MTEFRPISHDVIAQLHAAHDVICKALHLTSFTVSGIEDHKEMMKVIDARDALKTWLMNYVEPAPKPNDGTTSKTNDASPDMVEQRVVHAICKLGMVATPAEIAKAALEASCYTQLVEGLRQIAGHTWSDWTVPRDLARRRLTSAGIDWAEEIGGGRCRADRAAINKARDQ